ncbi:FG-GAP-like repeat-containing protein [Streptomyces sp. NBC_00445]|uniref:FG-GAP-like repeat-containing protein n=1 Tax=Streptomyces sp. NBC_00445 TaxID=2975745 RepID=UPI002E200CFF
MAAREKAADTGERVEIISERTETEEVFANPDGTLTVERSLLPLRVRQRGELVPVDPSLAVGDDGRIAPKATGTTFSFSNGGDGPLATMAKDGREIVLSWPAPLPRPALAGDTATYSDVLPGVDLTVTAAADSFSHTLVVKNAEAAKNPALAEIDFGLTGEGLDLTAEPNGELTALDPTGTPVFSAPKPRMWDSAGTASRTSAAAPRTADGAKDRSVRPLSDVLDGAADGSLQSDLDVSLTGRTLTLKPDLEMLADPATVYPVVIDPVWAKDSWKNAWSIAYKHTAYPGSENTVYWNGGTLSDDARVGYANDDLRGGTIRANTYFRIPTSRVWNKQILESTLRIKQTYAGSWSCKSGDIQVRTIGKSLPTNISWNNQPSWGEHVDSSGESFGGRNCPADSAGLVEFDVTSAINKAARGHWGHWAFVLSSKSNTIDSSYRKFDPASVRVSTRYNTKPYTPTSRSTDPSVPCTGGTFGTTDYVTLRAKVNDAEDNSLTAEFQYKKQGAERWITLKKKASRGTIAGVRIDGQDLSTGTYVWRVRGTDSTPSSSNWAGTCKFTYDKTRPSKLPGVSSKEFPEEENGNLARTNGTFVFTARGVADVIGYEWWTDSDTKVRAVKATKPGGPAEPVTHKPLNAGPQYMYVRSLDAASNRSDLREYLFYPVGKAERDKPRDLNGDDTTDLWSVDPGDGALWMHPGQATGKFGVGQQADDTSFGEAVTTHWGSWDEDAYEDLVALRPGMEDPTLKELWVYGNRGDGQLGGEDGARRELTVVGDDANHWRDADQIVAVGSFDDDDPDGKITGSDAPDLLVKSAGELWLYFGSRDANGFLDDVPPVSLGDADWQNMTLMAPGDLNKDGLPELWARDIRSGKIHQYTSRPNPVAGDTTAADLTVYGEPGPRETSIGTGFTGAAYPHLSTNGDFEGDGFADLWARDGQGSSVEFPGRAIAGGSAFGGARPLVTGGTPWAECENFKSSATGEHALCGPILAKYKALGGPSDFGYPDTDIKTAPDKIGRYAHFRSPGGTAINRSIYWSPDTGAWSVSGAIWTKWGELEREAGYLGYPTSDVRRVGNGSGRVTTFRKAGKAGAVYWEPDIGAFAMTGRIYAKYRELGGPVFMGFPMTDQKSTSPKAGAYQRFREPGEDGYTASMFYSGATGAWPVFGSVQKKWEELGAEDGWLGFPTSVEYEVAGGVRTDFEGGYIRWNRTSGVAGGHREDDRTAHLRTDLSGDVNGDGHTDLITVYNYENASTGIHVLPGTAAGGFKAPDEEPAWASTRAGYDYTRSKWAAGDFNGDGRADVAGFYGNTDGSITVWSFLATAEGTFEETKALTIPKGSWDWDRTTLLAGDINGDKRADLVAFYDEGSGTTSAHRFLSKADGTFNAPANVWTSNAGSWHYGSAKYAIGDTDGDGKDDLIGFYGYSTGAVALMTFPATTGGAIGKPVKSWNVEPGNWEFERVELTSGDYNGDGRADAAAMYGEDEGVTGLRTFPAKADGGFGDPLSSWRSNAGSWHVGNSGTPLSGDTDGDGREDIAVMYNYANGSTRAIAFRSREDGGFNGPRGSWYAEPGTW